MTVMLSTFFFFNDTATTEIYTLSHTTLFRSTLGDPLVCAVRVQDRPRPEQQGRTPVREVRNIRGETDDAALEPGDRREPQRRHRGEVVDPGPVPDRALEQGLHRRDLGHERSEEHTSELQSLAYLVCRLLLEK